MNDDEESLLIVVVYHSPSDYPGKFVARRHWAGAGGEVEVDPEPLIVADSLFEARGIIPDGMFRLNRDPNDEPQIVESWI